MADLEFVKLNNGNFRLNSLDNFKRRQKVTECWRKAEGGYVITGVAYTEDWDLAELRQLAERILNVVNGGGIAYGAVLNGEVAGFALLEKEKFGNDYIYIDLAEFYVSEPFRRQNIGEKLFDLACCGAKELGAEKLYISAHSAKESIAAYKKYGCVPAKEINERLAEKEPYDLQLEYELK